MGGSAGDTFEGRGTAWLDGVPVTGGSTVGISGVFTAVGAVAGCNLWKTVQGLMPRRNCPRSDGRARR